MRNERDSGYIDENFNYVFKKDDGEVDAWISGLDESAIEAAIGEAAAAEKKKSLQRVMEEEEISKKPRRTPHELKLELLSFLHPTETIITALRRLSGKIETNSGIKGKRTKPNTKAEDHSASHGNQRSKPIKPTDIAKMNKPSIDRVIEIANELIADGIAGIYSMTREAIYASTILWEYKGADESVYGPYTSQQISEWKSQGYFTGSTSVLMRQKKFELKKRAPPAAAPVTITKKVTSIYDEEEEEQVGTAAKRAKDNQGASIVRNSGVGTSTASAAAMEEESNSDNNDNPWINSDDIDFGEFINLDQESGVGYGARKNQDDDEGEAEEEDGDGFGKRKKPKKDNDNGYYSD